jgi:hypothetical protein
MREPTAPDDPADDQALRDAVSSVLGPLSRLAIDRGMTYPALEELLKRALVAAAQEAHQRAGGTASRLVSRISTTTGINRREVTRLTRGDVPAARESRSRASELFTHWLSDPDFRDDEGEPRTLPRQGAHPSFESLARMITQDVHPRSVLDELVRLRLATTDDVEDTVSLSREAFVPVGDHRRMLAFLGANVGDHLSAAVDNVCSPSPRHLERAVFAERFSADSIAAAEHWLGGHWSSLHAQLVPLLENLLAADRADASRIRDQRLRAGLYVYAAPIETGATPGTASRGRRATPASSAPEPAAPGGERVTRASADSEHALAAYGVVQAAMRSAAEQPAPPASPASPEVPASGTDPDAESEADSGR